MKVSKKIIIIMLISGAMSGLAGAGFLMSEKYRFTLDFSGSPGLGWDGMLIALLGSHNPVGILIAAIFYAALKTGSDYIGVFTNVPKDIVGVIQGILILLLSVKFFNEQFNLFGKFKILWKKSSSTDFNK
jgi:general nucleoside transport system permease protein